MSLPLKRLLSDILPDAELDLLVGSYDVVGDMAIIIIPEELGHREQLIGEAILTNNPRIQVVARRDGVYSGEFRTIPLKIIAGENRKETLHRENGVRLMVNPEEVYFSVRSSTERMRIAGLVEEGERILVIFSGIAPFPLVIAKNSGAHQIVGIEKNPLAHQYALKNLTLNKKIRNVKLKEGDAAQLLPLIRERFDRILLVLPKGGEPFLPLAIPLLREGGWIHYYDMRTADLFQESLYSVSSIARRAGRAMVHGAVVKCGHCGPRTYRICVDAQIR